MQQEVRKVDEYYTVAELVAKFKVTKQAVHMWIKDGKLEAIRLGRAVRIPAKSVEQFIQRGEDTAPHSDGSDTLGNKLPAVDLTPAFQSV
jgi:excisionase family DNA binding protein